MKILRALFIFSLFCNGMACSTLYEVPQHMDFKTQDYPTNFVAKPESIKLRKNHPELLTTKTLVISSADNVNPVEFSRFLRSSFASLGFAEVLDYREFQQKLIREKIIDQIGEATPNSLIGLAKISKVMSPFLWVESQVFFRSSNCTEVLRVIDPRSGEILFEYQDSRFMWVGANDECIYPMMNSVRDWYLESTGGVRTPQEATKPRVRSVKKYY